VSEDRLHELIRLLKKEDLTEITISEGDRRWTVKQAAQGMPMPVHAQPVAAGEPEQPAPVDDGTFALPAPLVGTFYSRPTPEDDPFVQPGAVVEPGTVVGIIEAMKVMNEVHAETVGRVRRVLVEDGASVEYGQELILFERL